MRRCLAILMTTVGLSTLLPGPARAGDGGTHVDVGTGPGSIYAAGKSSSESSVEVDDTANPTTLPPGQWISTPLCQLGGLALCDKSAVCPDGTQRPDTYYETESGTRLDEDTGCPSGAAPPAAPVLTPGRVLVAFRRLGLPESPLLIQPSGGETLVNFETVFHTTTGPFTRTVVLLGHRVRFAITPARFIWVWGDGGRRVTTWPGRPYVRGVPVSRDITHRYLTRDRFAPRLDTTYTATYSVDGGPARPVAGSVTITGTPRELATVTYTPLLVDD